LPGFLFVGLLNYLAIEILIVGIIKKIISQTYPLRMKVSKLTGMGISTAKNEKNIQPLKSFYEIEATANNGELISFKKYFGKKIIIVNLASKCGYTPQYEELEKLYQQYKDEIVVLGFPSNDFGGQEPGSDEQIAAFCKINFEVTFQLFVKDAVCGSEKQAVYKWLTDETQNGWNSKEPDWNFFKYLIDEKGSLHSLYSSSVSPLSILD